jgi:rRNA-processing protein FCF1
MAPDWIWGDRIHKTIILDTSAILMIFEYSVQLKEELGRLFGVYHIVIPRQVIMELTRLSQRGVGPRAQRAKAGLQWVSQYDVVSVEGDHGDDAVFNLAQKQQGIVVTNDRMLRKRLKEISLPVVFLRGKHRLMVE